MTIESFHPLDAKAMEFFARKCHEGGSNVPQVGQANGVKVLRVMQIIRDLWRLRFYGGGGK